LPSRSSVFFLGPEEKLNPRFLAQIFRFQNITKYYLPIYAWKIQKLGLFLCHKPRGLGPKVGKKCPKNRISVY